MPSKRDKWNNAGKDKVVLHMPQADTTRPNSSPFVVKLETFLRVAEIEYERDFSEPVGSKGKTPWITLNRKDYADSQFCIEVLNEQLLKDLDRNLSADQKGVARAMRLMLEDHFYWCYVTLEWVHNKARYGRKVIADDFLPGPKFLHGFIVNLIVKGCKKQAYAAGIGRHSKEEVERLGVEDLRALSSQLGDKPYLMGDEPTVLDCTAFGSLVMFLDGPEDEESAYKTAVNEEFMNLKAYHQRMKEKFYPDWDEQCYKPPVKAKKKEEDNEEEKEKDEKNEKQEDEEKKDEEK